MERKGFFLDAILVINKQKYGSESVKWEEWVFGSK